MIKSLAGKDTCMIHVWIDEQDKKRQQEAEEAVKQQNKKM